MWKTHTFFFIQNKLHWHIQVYRLLCGCTVSEKLPKMPLFGPSLIHQLRLLGSQQHPQSGVLLTSFSTWGTEYSLAEISLENTGGYYYYYLLFIHNNSLYSPDLSLPDYILFPKLKMKLKGLHFVDVAEIQAL